MSFSVFSVTATYYCPPPGTATVRREREAAAVYTGCIGRLTRRVRRLVVWASARRITPMCLPGSTRSVFRFAAFKHLHGRLCFLFVGKGSVAGNVKELEGVFASVVQCNGYLLLPVAGCRYRVDGAGLNRGSEGYYWSSEVSGLKSPRLYFDASGTNTGTYYRAYGFSVRCVQAFAWPFMFYSLKKEAYPGM